MLKQQARKAFIELRKSLSADECLVMNDKMLQQFRTVPLYDIEHLLSYYPIPQRKEFNTLACEEILKEQNAGLSVYWPKMLPEQFAMEAVLKDHKTRMVKNRFDIEEPENGEIIDPKILDVIFVPLLAFDQQGYRVGYGKGYYDRFLPKCSEDVIKIGFSYFEAIERINDIDQYDVPLNFCITPERIYEF